MSGLTPTSPDFDDLDTAIWDCRIRRHMSLRATAQEVGMSHEGVRDRMRRMLPRVTFPEVEEHRSTEGHRLETLAEQTFNVIAAAAEAGDLALALKGVDKLRLIRRDISVLFGLAATAGDRPAGDADHLINLLDAYLAGAAATTLR